MSWRNGLRVIDTDAHQMEPPGMWAAYIDPSFADRAPRIDDMGNGRVGMCVEGQPITKQDGSYPMHSKEFLEAAARGMEKHEKARAAGFGAQNPHCGHGSLRRRCPGALPHGWGADTRQGVRGRRFARRGVRRLQRLEPASTAPRPRPGCVGRRCCRCRRPTSRSRKPAEPPGTAPPASMSDPIPCGAAICITTTTTPCGPSSKG